MNLKEISEEVLKSNERSSERLREYFRDLPEHHRKMEEAFSRRQRAPLATSAEVKSGLRGLRMLFHVMFWGSVGMASVVPRSHKWGKSGQ